MGTPKIRGAKLLLRHPPRTLAQALGEQTTYDRRRADGYSLSCVVVACCCDECRRAKPYNEDHGAGERGKGERHPPVPIGNDRDRRHDSENRETEERLARAAGDHHAEHAHGE
jgi:hypothetical protein